MRTTKQLSIRVDEPFCRVTRLSYSASYKDRDNKRTQRILDRITKHYDELHSLGVKARISYEGKR